jgi:hypothetical protein
MSEVVLELELQELKLELQLQELDLQIEPPRTEAVYVVRPALVAPSSSGGNAAFERLEIVIPSSFSGSITLPHTPIPNSVNVYLNGLAEFNFYLTGQTLNIAFSTVPGDSLIITYAR